MSRKKKDTEPGQGLKYGQYIFKTMHTHEEKFFLVKSEEDVSFNRKHGWFIDARCTNFNISETADPLGFWH